MTRRQEPRATKDAPEAPNSTAHRPLCAHEGSCGGLCALQASGGSHKNADVAEYALVYAEKAVKALEGGSNTTFAKELDLERLIPALNFGLNAKSAKGFRECAFLVFHCFFY